MPEFSRRSRLRGLFLSEITAALRDVKDPGLSGFITVTDLELSNDQKTARVYWSLLGSVEDREKSQRALERAAPFLRQSLYGRLRVKYIPKIVFKFDDTPEQAGRIETILNKIRESPDEAGEQAETEAEREARRLNELASRQSRKARKRRR